VKKKLSKNLKNVRKRKEDNRETSPQRNITPKKHHPRETTPQQPKRRQHQKEDKPKRRLSPQDSLPFNSYSAPAAAGHGAIREQKDID